MRSHHPAIIAIAAAVVTLVCTRPAAAEDTWTEPYPGVQHLYRTADGPRRIHVLTIDLSRTDLRLRATRDAERGQRTSAWAASRGCEIAVNADFYAAGYAPIGLAIGSWDVWPGTADPATHGFVAVGVDNRVAISPPQEVMDPPEAWIADAVGAQPLLVAGGVAVDHSSCGGFCSRHPRTAAGLSADGETLILAAVDGRSSVSIGMTLNELAALMIEMGAETAINLDGGGSTTMYVAGEGGVVNAPSDGTERVVANHLGVCVVEPYGTLTGFVRDGDIYDASAGVAGATVALSSGQTTTTAGDGRYTIANVPAGDVTITATAPDKLGSRGVYVAADDTTWGSIALEPAADEAPDAGPGGGDASPGADARAGEDGGAAAAESGGCRSSRGGSAPYAVLAAALLIARRRRRGLGCRLRG